jgi:serine/threonine-protein kinase
MIAGSWAFMAPERHRGDPATPQSDIYSAGCVLWAMLTGQNPYSGTDVQMAMGHMGSPVPQLSMSDPAAAHLNQLLHRSMAKEPADRYASATAFLADAQALAATLASAPALITPMVLPENTIDDRTRVRPTAPPIDFAATTLRPSQEPQQPQPAPAPVHPPAGARPPATKNLVLLVVAGAITVAVVAGVLFAFLGGRHDSGPVAAAAPASTAAASPSAVVPSEFVCWNGEHNTNLEACGVPAGLDGLRYVYPSFDAEFDTCAREEPNSAERIAYACSYGGKSLIRYDYWFDGSAARAHYEESYKGASKTDLLAASQPIGRLYDWRRSHKGKYRLSGNWIGNSFGFSIEAATSKQQEALISRLQLRSAADVQGYAVGGEPGVVQPQIH